MKREKGGRSIEQEKEERSIEQEEESSVRRSKRNE